MRVSIVLPWREGCPDRGAAFRHVTAHLAARYPDWEQVIADYPGDWSKARAIIAGAAQADGDVIVMHDTDVLVADLQTAVDRLQSAAWVVPHYYVHRLTQSATEAVYRGADPWVLTSEVVERKYRGVKTGGVVVMSRRLLLEYPPDSRFVGWGGEDESWGHLLSTMVGSPWRGNEPLIHLWHPPAPRLTRAVGSVETEALATRYRDASRHPALMQPLHREVADEARKILGEISATD